jgi:Pyruvate/2-oxoglutarate dehydrogenase complex, dihydrolipoamide dehydrogenase (E3) component, and related enzymes
MKNAIEADLCVIGAGSGGLVVAAGAAQMGARTVLIERDRMGGDCLNAGCVPSKSLLAAARTAALARHTEPFGIHLAPPRIDAANVYDHVHGVIAAIAPHDSVARFESLGVRVILAAARFVDPRVVIAGGTTIRARRYVIATGSRPAIPPIPGLTATPFLTNETLFDLQALPEHLVVIGGGPIGVEMAQAYRLLGARVTLIEQASLLSRDDPDLVAVVRRRLQVDGIHIEERARVERVCGSADAIAVEVIADGQTRRIEGSHLLVAAGRRVGIDDLGLEQAGIACSPRGITVDRRLRTTNRRVFAIGDCVGGEQFTHVAGYHAAVVLKNALFRWPAKADLGTLPRVTYADPELAQVGMTEAEARAAGLDVRILTSSFADNDRAQAERRTEGMAKVVVTPGGGILGAGLVGAHASELIHVWVLAMSQRLKVGALATMIAPYPTLGEINKRVAGAFYAERLFRPMTRRIVRLLSRFG